MGKLQVGTRVRLWPKDTYAKYGVVRSVTDRDIIIEITEIDPRDHCRYRIGDKIKLSASRLSVLSEQEFKDRYC
ncbi:hypothetical protein Desca_2355 [Desulfotomaculum nigrificans CO-1-SRB]|uniref:Uncharacterized protein n=1 Tax=Desulfotomaculum nigrificans (strain DSM 14880 / VKM B-2319 / CO-1-SRB) TaxID=868595 RepID=F6B3N1_DESCC|nr:hypothetical protein [Desulfotomaculum nigrificans]AEF95190.1 hypothetical protein Desca_2355 [Desulfotomaculum nigrificans CO-1-SRB]